MSLSLSPAVFLDRDGTVMEEVHYCRDPEKVRIFPRVTEALRDLKSAGYKLVLVTNQSGIARGIISHEQYEAVHARMLELLGEPLLDAAYMCADGPDSGSHRRKPNPGMLLEAAADLQLDLARSWMIGDKLVDIDCAKRAGVGPILVRTGYGSSLSNVEAAHIADDVADAAHWILTTHPRKSPSV